jgi:alpha-beta hydrolase superfamily lysophospholipase
MRSREQTIISAFGTALLIACAPLSTLASDAPLNKSCQSSWDTPVQISLDSANQPSASTSGQISLDNANQPSASTSGQISSDDVTQTSSDKANQTSSDKANQTSSDKVNQTSSDKANQTSSDKANQTSLDEASQSSSGSADQALALQSAANQFFWKRDYKNALESVSKLLADSAMSQQLRARCLINRAICEAQLELWEEARKDSADALKLAAPKSLTEADAASVQARVLLLDGKPDKARLMYEKAIDIISTLQGLWNADLAPFYEGLAACELLDKNYEKAERYYKQVAQLDLLKYGPDDTHLAWALMSLSGVERRLNHVELANTLFKKVFWNFRHQNELRILGEHKDAPNQEELARTLQHHMYGSIGGYKNQTCGLDFVKSGIPADVLTSTPLLREKTFENWFKERVGREKAPGLAFFNPTMPLKGLIVTVHGLGLYSGAYSAFGERIQKEGYGLVSFDVRGFGSYRNDEVTQQLDLLAAVNDIQRILREMRTDYPDIPIILLGESMGGAIALRIAAESPGLIDAVVSSVPSGSRYQAKKTALKVALKFLNQKHEQFDVGTAVVEQATADVDLRDMWEGDSQMRMKLSPSELVNFQSFMGDNIKSASKITKTPVIIFQGYSDNLVKPMGTLAIYQAIPNKDKDMIFIGRAEHLIFEEGQFDEVIFRGVLEWINRHAASFVAHKPSSVEH